MLVLDWGSVQKVRLHTKRTLSLWAYFLELRPFLSFWGWRHLDMLWCKSLLAQKCLRFTSQRECIRSSGPAELSFKLSHFPELFSMVKGTQLLYLPVSLQSDDWLQGKAWNSTFCVLPYDHDIPFMLSFLFLGRNLLCCIHISLVQMFPIFIILFYWFSIVDI